MCKNYTEGVVIFLDLLGTKSCVHNFSKAYNALRVFIDKVEAEAHFNDVHPRSVYERFVTVFSDCAYIIYNYKPDTSDAQKDKRKLLLIACDNTEKIICTLLQQGVLVRGGLTYGKVFHEKSCDNNTLCFGEAMNEAYRLESKVAVVPRVVVDERFAPEIVALTEKLKKYDPDGSLEQYNIVIKDNVRKDDNYVINFMNTLERGFATVYGNSMLQKIGEMCLAEKDRSPSICEKYAWLEQFVKEHNNKNSANIEMTDAKKAILTAQGIDFNYYDVSKTQEEQLLEDV